jgi:hypothetical protein
MAKAYLNMHLRLQGESFVPVKADIMDKPGWCCPAEELDCLWVTLYEQQGETFAAARRRIEFMLDRGDLQQIPALVLEKRLVEKTTGLPIGNGTILELMPAGRGFGPDLPPSAT